jgi:drug/metabolite transporter (DMT)-like permease
MKPHTLAVLQALFVVFLWATSWVFVKIGLQSIPPVTFAGLRYFLAFLCLLAVLLFGRSRRELKELSGRDWVRFILLGILLYAGTQGAVFVVLAYLPAVTVNLLWSFSSVVIALLGAVLLSEHPRALQWVGMSLAVLGGIIYFYPVDIPRNQILGLLVGLIGVLANAFASILGRDINRLNRHSPLVVTVVSMGVGSVLLLIGGIAVEPNPTLDLRSWGIVLWLAMVNTAFAFTLWNHTLRTLTAMESSIINGTMLVWVAIFAVLFLGETITAMEAMGLAVTSLGTIIVQVRRSNMSIERQASRGG